jgi:alkanesulfonate monooxygenase SsuD/methylene tetrahydromethanopterin reductase-like flavin-dependent oxidoreductase (luciferase family)
VGQHRDLASRGRDMGAVRGSENDQAIPPDAERQFAKRMGATTVEAASGHVAMVSHPDAVAELIETAAKAVGAAN